MARSTRSSLAVPIVLGASALGIVLVLAATSGKAAEKTPPSPPVPPRPPAPPAPVPVPVPTDPQTLLAQAQALLLQAGANPQSVDPAQLDALAIQADAFGQPALAAQLRQTAAILRGQIPAGLPNAFETPPPASTPQQVPAQVPVGLPNIACTPGSSFLPGPAAAHLQMLDMSPNPDPAALETFAAQIEPCGFLTVVTRLRQRARQIRQARGENV